RPHFELDRSETVAQRDMLGVDRERPLVALDRLAPPSAVPQYIAEIAEIERVARSARDGPTQQPDRIIEARFAERDQPRQVQSFGVLGIVREHARVEKLRLAQSPRVV